MIQKTNIKQEDSHPGWSKINLTSQKHKESIDLNFLEQRITKNSDSTASSKQCIDKE